MSITHQKVSFVPDNQETEQVQPSDWNDTHTVDPAALAAEIYDDLNSLSNAVTVVSADHTVAADDSIILVNGTATITLTAGEDSRVLIIKNIGSGTVTVAPDGAETIDGEASKVISFQYSSMTIVSYSSNWYII
jgi:archaellum component FlaG (FlaF/FlaG flagellin family)